MSPASTVEILTLQSHLHLLPRDPKHCRGSDSEWHQTLCPTPELHHSTWSTEELALSTGTGEELQNIKTGQCKGQKLKRNTDPTQAIEAHRGSRGIPPLILNLTARWRWLVNVTPTPLYHRERTRYSLNRRVGGLDNRYGSLRGKYRNEGTWLALCYGRFNPQQNSPHYPLYRRLKLARSYSIVPTNAPNT